ncbi:heparanase-like protein 3 [Coffea eugenioides]|uniref:heparanase-like protein 3 n=1 Tax=Coffea eugenioides TaxID=49369 RepID=UPI000F607192|nr:heparanase-like protein 3 [Coffea eugenioides]
MASCAKAADKFAPNTLLYEMASLLNILGLCLWLFLTCQDSKKVVSQNITQGSLFIDGSASVGSTDANFICATLDWWPPEKCDYGGCSWGNASLLNLDLSNKVLLNAVKAFSPLKIRLGGTLQDKVVYQNADGPRSCNEFVRSIEMFGFTEGCLPMSRWDELNKFFTLAGAEVIFGLNALHGRTIGPGNNVIGPWNSSNAESLIRYTVSNNYTIYGWELGNELSGNGIGASVAADQYASDVIHLQNIVQDAYKDFQSKPLVLGPGGFFDAGWFSQFINEASNSLQAVTHHIYNLGPGSDDHLVDKILDPSYLDGGSQPFRDLQRVLKTSGASTKAWVGEAGGAYNSGRNLVTNTFAFSFWYLDQLGMASSYDTKTYCRQTLVGGNYGLLNTTTFVPNPDYYSALLWHRLMGRNVLATNLTAIKNLRAYAHCSKLSHGITVLLINLDAYATVQVGLSVQNTIPTNRTSIWLLHQHSRHGKFTRYNLDSSMRKEYHLTAKHGNIHSQIVLLNGKILSVDSSGTIPPLEPRTGYPSDPITVAPFSIVFADIPNILVPACK